MHAFGDGVDPVIDDTVSDVAIDGIHLDPVAVRTMMAQSAPSHAGSCCVRDLL